MSEVVATILLLALTVTLFSSIFYFVNSFPAPSPQPTNQFTASLSYNLNGSKILGISILHLAGPAVSGQALVYLYSSANPTRFTTPFTVASGLPGSPQVWNLGQTWFQNLTSYSLGTPNNITVSLTTSSELLFRVTLPGANPQVPPVFTNVGTTPTSPTVGKSFTVYCQISDALLRPLSPYVNLSQIPGVTGKGLFHLTFSATNGTWYFVVPGGTTTTPGVFYAFINASDSNNLANTIAFTITLVTTPGQVTAVLSASPIAPVVSAAVTLTAYVTDGSSSAVLSTVTFSARSTLVGTSSGSVPAGSTGAFQTTWTPSTAGVYLLQALVNSSGGSTISATLNVTVYPPILLVAHNTVAGSRPANNESALLAQELTADGYPFATSWVSCTGSLTASLFTGYSVVVIDYGSNTTRGCPTAASSTDQGIINTLTTTTSVVLLGSDAFDTAACATYNSAYFGDFGLTWTSGSTCMTIGAAAAAAAYTGTPASGLRSDGIPAGLTYNKTLGTGSGFVPYETFARGVTSSFIKVGGNPNAAFRVSGSLHYVAMAGDPALLTATLPAPSSASWGTGGGGADVMYNIMGFATGLATSGSPGRALIDFGADQVTLVGQSHTRFSTIYVGVRQNGPIGGIVSATLLVNGTVALLSGVLVTASTSLNGAGSNTYLVLTWLAPSAGSFTLAIVISSVPAGLNGANNEMPFNVLSQSTVFT